MPPPGRAKVAQTPGRARVKNSICDEFSNIYLYRSKSREVTSQNSNYSKKLPADFDVFFA